MNKKTRILISGLTSIILSYIGFTIWKDHLLSFNNNQYGILLLSPGFFFGVLILIPKLRVNLKSIIRAVALLLLSMLVWIVTFYFTFFGIAHVKIPPVVVCPFSGLLGALSIIIGANFIGPFKIKPNQFFKLICLCVAGGLLLGLSHSDFRNIYLIESLTFLGFFLWQFGMVLYL